MLSLDQCVDFCGLTEEEVDLLARDQGLPSIIAAEMGCELLKTAEGRAQLAYILRKCAHCAVECGNLEDAARCFRIYKVFHERLTS